MTAMILIQTFIILPQIATTFLSTKHLAVFAPESALLSLQIEEREPHVLH